MPSSTLSLSLPLSLFLSSLSLIITIYPQKFNVFFDSPQLGAITVTCGGVVNLYDGDLTFVGEILESLPISARLGRLLLLGHVFDCLEECLVIAAALGQRSIFTKPFQREMQAYRYIAKIPIGRLLLTHFPFPPVTHPGAGGGVCGSGDLE